MVKKYPQFERVNIDDFLMSFQGNIKFDMDEFEREADVTGKYDKFQSTYTLELNKARKTYEWSK